MWDILAAAAVGAAFSLLGWVLRSFWEARRSRMKTRRLYVAGVLDSGVLEEVDNFAEDKFDLHVFSETIKLIPSPSTLSDIEARGELSTARQRIIDQLRDLYDLRVSENAASRYFSSTFDKELLAFRQRLIRWTRKGSAEDLFKMLA